MAGKNKHQALKYLAVIAVTIIATFLLNNYTSQVYNPFSCTYNKYSCSSGGVAGGSGSSGGGGSGSNTCPTTPDLNCNSCRTGYTLMNGICTPNTPSTTPSTPTCREYCASGSLPNTLEVSNAADCYRVSANTCFLSSTTHTLLTNYYFDITSACCCYKCY